MKPDLSPPNQSQATNTLPAHETGLGGAYKKKEGVL
jgi:hypothetical protein